MTDKIVHPSYWSAQKHLKGINKRTHRKRGHVYRCEFCGQWHTTSQERR